MTQRNTRSMTNMTDFEFWSYQQYPIKSIPR